MYKFLLTGAITFVFFISCKTQHAVKQFIYSSGDVAIEKLDTLNKDENKYNYDNKIYTVGKVFTYSYYYQDKEGKKLLMKIDTSLGPAVSDKWRKGLVDSSFQGWVFAPIESTDTNIIRIVRVTVEYGLKGFKDLPIPGGYNQTVIQYALLNRNEGSIFRKLSEGTGVIENKKNIWIHPPRTKFFGILEINPFPYIKRPYKIGNSWTWELSIGNHWSDRRWLIWEGRNLHTYKYTITKKIKLQTKLGNLRCYVVESVSNSKIGTTALTAYFNEKYGFVKLDYTNIDGTKTFMELEKVK